MTETVTVRGFLGSDVRAFTTKDGVPISTFRLASTVRRFDRESRAWVNAGTNWYSVSSFRALAQNAHDALAKGDPVMVTGRLRIRQWENDDGVRGTAAEIDAASIGHDLGFGTSVFTRAGNRTEDFVDDGPDRPEAGGAGHSTTAAQEAPF